MPLLPAMEEVMDEMYVWGQTQSYQWYCETLELLAYFTENAIDPSRMFLVSEVIDLYAKILIGSYFQRGSFTYSLLTIQFGMQFEEHIYSPSKTFYEMANSAKAHLELSIAQMY